MLKIVCVTIGEMGHFVQIVKCATALAERGHDVHIVTNGHEYIREKAKKFVSSCITVHHTDDGLKFDALLRKPDGCEDPTNTYMQTWYPFCLE